MTELLDLKALLPVGEWADIRVIPQAGGMMAGRRWAILAKARWLRGGGRPAFIKFIIPAGSEAGETTNLVTRRSRLEDLDSRLQKLQALGESVPTVPIFQVALMSEGLLVAMAEVEDLQKIIERGDSHSFSLRVLRDLAPATSPPAWIHFDICPKNIGVTPEGKCVFIDLESLYLANDQAQLSVTVPAWKDFRAPENLRRAVMAGLAHPAFEHSLAIRKMTFEITLAAAECVLGPVPPDRGPLDIRRLRAWVAHMDLSDPVVDFWVRTLSRALEDDGPFSIKEIGNELGALLGGKAPNEEQRRAGVIGSERPVTAVKVSDTSGNSLADKPPADLLRTLGIALRSGGLNQSLTTEYRRLIEQELAQNPQRRDLWDELLTIVIAYQRDAAGALIVVRQALEQFPDDSEFRLWSSIVGPWAMEDRDGP